MSEKMGNCESQHSGIFIGGHKQTPSCVNWEPVASPQATRPTLETAKLHRREAALTTSRDAAKWHIAQAQEIEAAQPAAGTTPKCKGCGQEMIKGFPSRGSYDDSPWCCLTCGETTEGTTPQAERPSCPNPYHDPDAMFCIKCLPEGAHLGALLISTRKPTTSDIKRGQEIATELGLRAVAPVETPRAVKIGFCDNPRVRLIQAIPAAVEKDQESGQFVASFARGDSDEWGHGDTETGAMEDLSRCAAESFLHLREIPDDKLSAHLAKQKSILGEYFALRVAVETRLTAEQFADELEETLHDLSGITFDVLMHETIKHKLEAFRDKSEAGLRAKLTEQKKVEDDCQLWNREAVKWQVRAEAAEAEAAALRERERWIPE